ncbi:MAG: hypothetical protein HRU70_01170 [Phycisphaeraceae bacterium]|nr:MAG: hypothetical protein HRU70_01170 [Phycisphaeraceae bacterium]
MGLNRERKLFASVLALAAAGLALDRFVLESGVTSPASASAATDPAAPVPKPAPKEPAPPSLAQRLRDAGARDAPHADIFSATPPWLAATPEPARATPAEPDPVEQFLRVARVTKVVGGGPNRSGAALIDGRPVYVGKNYAGATLTAVDRDAGTATFLLNGREVVVRVDGDDSTR